MRLLSTLAVATLLAAAAAPVSAEVKLGAVRLDIILRDAPQVKDADTKLKAEFQKKEDELDTEGKKLQDDFKKYQRDADSMSAQQRATAEKDLNTRKIDYDLKQRQYSEQAQNRNNELRQDVLNRVQQAIEEVAKEKNIDMVLQNPAYAAANLDITDDVLKKLGVSASAPTAAPAAKKSDTKKK